MARLGRARASSSTSPSSQGAIYLGDPLIPLGTMDAYGVPAWGIATAGATNVIGGSFLGRSNGPAGSGITLLQSNTIYHPTSTAGYGFVCDDPDVMYSVQDDGSASITAGGYSNANLQAGSGGSTAHRPLKLATRRHDGGLGQRHLPGQNARAYPRPRQCARPLRALERHDQSVRPSTGHGRPLRLIMAAPDLQITNTVSGQVLLGMTERGPMCDGREHKSQGASRRTAKAVFTTPCENMAWIASPRVLTTSLLLNDAEFQTWIAIIFAAFGSFRRGYNATDGGEMVSDEIRAK